MFFDLNVRGGSLENNLELAGEASRYGWNHVSFSYGPADYPNALKFRNELDDELGGSIAVDFTLEVKSNNINEIRKIVNKFRGRSSCISVVGGDLKVNRAALENVRVDVLSRPYLRRYDSGINHVLAKEAVRNNVAIELCFKDVLRSYRSHRSKVLSNFRDVYALHRKYDFALVLSSGAESTYDMRTVQDFVAFFAQTGLSDDEIAKAFEASAGILDFNRNRDKMIFNGVRRVDDGS